MKSLNRLRSGTHMLKMRNSIDKRAGLSGDKICTCRKAVQDVNHYLLECEDVRVERNVMLDRIKNTVLKVDGINPKVDTPFLIGQFIPKKLQPAITSAVCE